MSFKTHAPQAVPYFNFCKGILVAASRADISEQLKDLFKFFLEVLDLRSKPFANQDEVGAHLFLFKDRHADLVFID